MSRIALVAEIDPRHLGALGFLAGLLQGQGMPQGEILTQLLESIQEVEVPDSFGKSQETSTAEDESVPEETEEEATAITDPDVEITPENDPTAPENLGIDLGDRPPSVEGGFVPQSWAGETGDVGAGPPPGEA